MRLRIFAAAAICGAWMNLPAAAQESVNPALRSQQRAGAVLNDAIAAAGGFARLRGLRTVTQHLEFAQGMPGQAPNPAADTGGVGQALPWSRTTDLTTGNSIIEVTPPGAPAPVGRLVLMEEGSFIHRIPQRQYSMLRDLSIANYDRRLVFEPALLLEAWDNPMSLRYLGRFDLAGHPSDAVAFVDRFGDQCTLYFDGETKLLTRSERLSNQMTGPLGDAPISLDFADYAAIDGVMVPGSITEMMGPYLTARATQVSTSFNDGFDASLLTIPEGLTEAPGGAGAVLSASEMTVHEVMDGIYQIEEAAPGYHVTFAELDDYVVVIDGLYSDEVSQATIQKIAEVVPGKPIRYVVSSHHHFDHSGGLPAYMAQGATVLTAAGNEDYVRRMAAAPRIRYDGITPLEGNIQVVEHGQSFGSGPNRFELYDVGPNPHADHILIVYFPERKLIWVADIYEYFEGFTPPPLLQSFADSLAALGLDYDMFVAAHGLPKTAEQYRAAVAAVRGGN